MVGMQWALNKWYYWEEELKQLKQYLFLAAVFERWGILKYAFEDRRVWQWDELKITFKSCKSRHNEWGTVDYRSLDASLYISGPQFSYV